MRADNPPALAAYRALGYREHVRFEERLAHRRGALWDSIVMPIRARLLASQGAASESSSAPRAATLPAA